MISSFGARLKAQRERQQVTLETIAERTKIRAALLQGLERDDISGWPAGIFRRSYLRSYAAAIGLDPEPAVREFAALYPEPAEEAPAAMLAEAASGQSGHRPRTRLHYLLASAIGVVSKPFDKEQPVGIMSDGAAETALPLVASGVTDGDHIVGGASSNIVETDIVDVPVVVDEFVDDAAEPNEEAEWQPPAVQVDLSALAELSTRIVAARNASELEALLGEAARILHAVGIIVWPWDAARGVLVPSLSHGYPRRTLARLPTVAPDADNPIGAAYRSSARQVVAGGSSATSAIVVPLTTPRGCAGVLAVECTNGVEQDAAVQAMATILAAQLSLPVEAVEAVQAMKTEPSRHAIA